MNDIRDERKIDECLSSYALERGRLFSDTPSEREHLAGCPECRERAEAMDAVQARFETEIYPMTISAVTRRIQQRPSGAFLSYFSAARRRSAAISAVGLAAAALAALAIAFPFQKNNLPSNDSHAPLDTNYLGDKGGIGLEVFCKRGEKVFRVHEGRTLYADDMLRFVPRLPSEGKRYIMVVSVDSRGTVSRYFPADSSRAEGAPTGPLPLPGSVVLDETVGLERIWLLSGDKPFAFEDVEKAAASEWRRIGNIANMSRLPLDLEQVGILFLKERAPQNGR